MPKTIDERLDALVQSVKVIAGMQRTNEKNLGQLLDVFARLERIVKDHEHRIDGLEH